MADFTLKQQIENAREHLEDLKRDYLAGHGWEYTCNTPGSFWLWRRDFATEDAARHSMWKQRGPGPYGWPSEPRPYGVITANTDLAVSITERELDCEVDQDGDPETPYVGPEDEFEQGFEKIGG